MIRSLAARCQEVFERDLPRSRRYTLEDFEKRSLWERFIEWVMLPFHSQYRRNRRQDVCS